jgi:hypothetical protein
MAKADLKNTAFKVGDEVVCTGRPFGLHEIIKQLPGSGERQYRIGPPPIRSQDGKVIKASEERKQRDVGENELMRLDEALDELLKLLSDAKSKKDGATRTDLLAALCCARVAYDERTKKPLPADTVRQLKESIRTTRRLLAKAGITSTVLCKIGGGIIDVSPLPVEIPVLVPFQTQVFKIFKLDSAIEGTAIVSIPDLLKAWHSSLEKLPTKKREGQPKEYKSAIVEYAIRFFCQHSAAKPSTNPTNDVAIFVQRFYECVTGSALDKSLDYQIRKVLKALKVQACAALTKQCPGKLEIDHPKS